MRKRGFKSKIDLQKENVELKKINKILIQQIDTLKKKIIKLEQIELDNAEKKTEEKNKMPCPECSNTVFSFARISKSVFLVCKNCGNKKKL